jgi:hypothetical protein
MASHYRTHAALLLTLIASALTGCNDSQNSAAAPTQAPATETPAAQTPAPVIPAIQPPAASPPAANPAAAPGISGTPPKAVAVGASYLFAPRASDAGTAKLTFSIVNQPSWATFDALTGRLSGTPAASDVGTSGQITISVSDGAKVAALGPFSISVTQPDSSMITLSWTPSVLNTNGTTSTNLDGYHIYYGSTATALTHVVTVGTDVTSYVFNKLASGTWYFAVATVNLDKVESSLSAIVPVQLGS